MTATVPEQLRTFHVTGHGLEAAIPSLTFDAIAQGRAIPAQESVYPIRLAAGPLVGFDAGAAVTLPIAALLDARAPRHAAFIETLRQAAERLEDLLALDDSHAADAVSPASLTNSLGAGGNYLNTANLTAALRRRTNPVHRMTPERRERCATALTSIRQALAVVHPPFALFHTGPVDNPLHGQLHHSSDPCAAAVEHARNQLTAIQGTLRALRLARLEIDDAYDPALHDAILQRFRWEAAEVSEIAAQPPVIAVLTAAEAAHLPLQSLSRALRSDCPILVIITQPALTSEDLKANGPDLAQIALAHPDAFVLHSSLAALAHLQPSLAALAQCVRPAIAIIATPSAGGWPEASLMTLSKAWPLFTYDPNLGGHWRDHLDLYPIEPSPWTAAHAAACNPTLHNHFRTVAEDEPDPDPIEIDNYLARYQRSAPLAIPYLKTSTNTRVAISRDLAEFCHERQQAYTVLAESTPKPSAPPAPAAPSAADTEQAMRQGAQIAIARAVELLTGVKPQ